MSEARVLVLGWMGATERQLRPLADHLARRGLDVVVELPRAVTAMSRPGGWPDEGKRLAERLRAAHAERPLPFFVHSFSNAGFWGSRALFEALPPDLLAAHRGTWLDSAPGFPERVTLSYSATYAPRAMLPGLLARLGRPPRHRHPLLSPPLALAFGAWHFAARPQIRAMEESLRVMRRVHRDKPLFCVWGGQDELVPEQYVAAFADAAEREGARVERLYFPEGRHVRHMFAQRQAYFRAAFDFYGVG